MIKTFSDIGNEIRELQSQLEAYAEEHDGDITEFGLMDHLVGLQEAQKGIEAKEHMLCSLACMALEYEDEAEAMKAQAKRITENLKKIEAKSDGIRKFISENIQPGDKIKDDRVTLSTRKSQSVEVVCDATDLPFEFQRVKVDADKALIKKALEAGTEITGCAIISRYNLQIK